MASGERRCAPDGAATDTVPAVGDSAARPAPASPLNGRLDGQRLATPPSQITAATASTRASWEPDRES